MRMRTPDSSLSGLNRNVVYQYSLGTYYFCTHHLVIMHKMISTLYFAIFCKNPDLFVDGTPNQGLLNDPPDDYCIIPSTCYPFHLLFFCPIVFKRHFWHPGQWFDGTPNLGSSFWMIHYDLLPVTCQLPPATWYLRHLWRQKQVADQCEVYASPLLLLRTSDSPNECRCIFINMLL